MNRSGVFILAACAFAAVFCVSAANSFEIPESVTMSSKKFDGYTPKKGDVIFNHASHMQIPCADCHHTVVDSYSIDACMTEGCHDNVNVNERSETSSVYRTFHTTKDTTKSCVGCHRDLKKQGPSDAPLACNSCHTGE